MKKLSTFFAGILLLLVTINSNAQSKTGADYYEGKWSVLLKGIPGGDSKLIFVLSKNDSTMTGVVKDTTGAEITKLTSVELKGDEITLFFTAQGYDVNLVLKRKDDDHVTGSLMGMFEAEGERVKEMKQ